MISRVGPVKRNTLYFTKSLFCKVMTSLSGLKVRNFLLAKKIFSLVDLGCHIRTSSSIRVVQDHHPLVCVTNLFSISIWRYSKNQRGFPFRHSLLKASLVIF